MPGRHFLQIPGPTNVPDRILRAMDRPVPDHRGPELPALVEEILAGLKQVFQTARGEIVLYPGSGTAAWEASLVNTVSPGERVLAFNIGHFSHLYADCARRLGAAVDEIDLAWGEGVPRTSCASASRTTPRTPTKRSSWCTTRPRPGSP